MSPPPPPPPLPPEQLFQIYNFKVVMSNIVKTNKTWIPWLWFTDPTLRIFAVKGGYCKKKMLEYSFKPIKNPL